VGGAAYLAGLTQSREFTNVEHHARIIVQKYIQRELIRVSNAVIKDSYEDVKDVLIFWMMQSRIYIKLQIIT
jgi:replicative DNA helicase